MYIRVFDKKYAHICIILGGVSLSFLLFLDKGRILGQKNGQKRIICPLFPYYCPCPFWYFLDNGQKGQWHSPPLYYISLVKYYMICLEKLIWTWSYKSKFGITIYEGCFTGIFFQILLYFMFQPAHEISEIFRQEKLVSLGRERWNERRFLVSRVVWFRSDGVELRYPREAVA